MIKIEVTNCLDCHLFNTKGGFKLCSLTLLTRPYEEYVVKDPKKTPEWCPLLKEECLIKHKEQK